VFRTRTRLVPAVIGFLLFCATARPSAHPTATTAIMVGLPSDRSITVTFTSDADALLAKLTALSGRPLAKVANAGDRQRQLVELAPVLAAHLDVRVDGRPVDLIFDSADVSSSFDAVVRFRSAISPDARELIAQTSLIYGSYPLTVLRGRDPVETVQWLNGTERSVPIQLADGSRARTSLGRALIRDVWLGYSHILPGGLDHILFVVGLFLLNQRLRSILLQVSAFTVAHSITLGLTLYGVVSLPAAVVEPLIALSIVYVACENLLTSTLRPWRIGLVFAFGLLHGMGFADALARMHLARSEFLTTLVGFNVGVEAGQLSVLAIAAVALRAAAMAPPQRQIYVARPASVAIALIGAMWVVQRLVA
jgi:HupE/UreJ protein